ncbi:site-specific integrase [Rufibacter roseus]|uniref:Phage integrase SAM-like domain-containing protein n=1 Tax=Rufibacter roseus TaxID=1567108 RepID=A0ABW2DRF4_9BACT|nr:site-specific integrase [Rufibacter roseus]
MASVSFVLKEPNSKEETLVYLLFRFSNSKLKFSTGEKILPKFWNPEKQKAKETKQFPEFPEFNSRLDNIEKWIKSIYRKLLNDEEEITLDKLRAELTKKVKPQAEVKKLDLIAFADELIKNTSKKPNTVKNYKQALVKLKEFKEAKRKPLEFESINLEFYNDFTKYLQERGFSINSIGGFIKNIKVFMNEATDRGLNKNLEYLNKRFRVIEEHSDTIYLTQEEITKIYELDLSENSRLERVRDLFIVGCNTGLRFSDLNQINSDNFISNGSQIKVKTEKTGETVIIPVGKRVKEILDKYKGVLPNSISNQKMNDYLKEICELAELCESVLVSITKGGKKVQESFKKHELISTHTARRSFATNLYLADVPSITIMKMTGHKTEKAFLKYIRLTQEQNAQKLVNHPFFN